MTQILEDLEMKINHELLQLLVVSTNLFSYPVDVIAYEKLINLLFLKHLNLLVSDESTVK